MSKDPQPSQKSAYERLLEDPDVARYLELRQQDLELARERLREHDEMRDATRDEKLLTLSSDEARKRAQFVDALYRQRLPQQDMCKRLDAAKIPSPWPPLRWSEAYLRHPKRVKKWLSTHRPSGLDGRSSKKC